MWRPAAETMAHAWNEDAAKISMKEVKHDRMMRIEWKAPHIVEVAKSGRLLRLCDLLLERQTSGLQAFLMLLVE